MKTLRLSRRNLEALLSKLDRKAAGEETACTIIKNDQGVAVTAFEDEEYYKDRAAGEMHPADSPPVRNSTGTQWAFGPFEILE